MKKKSRNTPAKAEILTLLNKADGALSHAEVERNLQSHYDRVTIYRVLDRLVNEGEAHRIVNIDGIKEYAICHDCTVEGHHHNHIHFCCEKCGTMSCLKNVELAYHLPNDYKINEVNFVISGICPNCR